MVENSKSVPGDPSPEPCRSSVIWLGVGFRSFFETLFVGLFLGLADILYTGDLKWIGWAYCLAGVVLGMRHAGGAWPCWPTLGASLYTVHIVAIACGRKQPYVEAGYQEATATLWIFFPAGLSLAVGAIARRLLAALGWFQRKDGLPVRLLPRTTRGVLVVVAGIGLALGLTRWIVIDSETHYSAGYDEGRFHQIRVGIPCEQIEAMLGPPLQKVDWGEDGTQNWMYTTGTLSTSNYWRRWIFVKQGKVQLVVSDYWWD